jgi:DNA-directed RNA polymerase subunit omega
MLRCTYSPMARVTVEDCIDKVESPYELVLVAKERATQLNAGIEPTIEKDNDKNTVISLREIADEKIKVSDLTESAVYKLRKHVEQVDDSVEDDEEVGDDFESLYKGEISKSGTPILPSKRARKTPEKIQVSKEDLAELSETAKTDIDSSVGEEMTDEQEEVSLDEISDAEETTNEKEEVSSDEISDAENQEVDANIEDTETSNT